MNLRRSALAASSCGASCRAKTFGEYARLGVFASSAGLLAGVSASARQARDVGLTAHSQDGLR